MKPLLTARHMILVAFAFLAFVLPAAAETADDTEHFLLPETPPTIERVKKPPLDRPSLKRQNFVSDNDIVSPPVLLDMGFAPLYTPEYPVSVAIGQGSYASSDGSFVYASKTGWQVSCRMQETDGEFDNLARQENLFAYRLDRFVSPGLRAGGSIDADQNTVWTQRHDWYHAASSADWFIREDMSFRASIEGASGEIKGQESNVSWKGDFLLNLQPTAKQNIALSYAPRGDSAFTEDSAFATAGLMYDILFSRVLTVGAGCRLQKDKLFPQGDMNYVIAPRVRLNVLYQPGFDRPDWASLYIGDRFEKTNPGLLLSENNYFVKEKLSYYWGEDSSVGLVFSQADWKNYIVWSQAAGTSFVAPLNVDKSYVSTAGIDFACRLYGFRATAGAATSSNTELPYVPEYNASLGLSWTGGSWVLASGYHTVSAMSTTLAGTERLPAFGNLSLSVQKTIVRGINIILSADNLLQERIESQSGFYRKGSAFRAGLNLQF